MASITIDLGDLISGSIPKLDSILKAIVKGDVSGFTELPTGTIKWSFDSSGVLSFDKLLDDGTWQWISAVNISASKLGGYSASTIPQANTIPVRDANGNLTGNLAGNAQTATTAQNVSGIVSTANGGTGANNIIQARANLDVPSKAELITKYDKTGGQITGDVAVTRPDGSTAPESPDLVLDNGTSEIRIDNNNNKFRGYKITKGSSATPYIFEADENSFDIEKNASIKGNLNVVGKITSTIDVDSTGLYSYSNANFNFEGLNSGFSWHGPGVGSYSFFLANNGQFYFTTSDGTAFAGVNTGDLNVVGTIYLISGTIVSSTNKVTTTNIEVTNSLTAPTITADEYYLSDGSSLMGMPDYSRQLFIDNLQPNESYTATMNCLLVAEAGANSQDDAVNLDVLPQGDTIIRSVATLFKGSSFSLFLKKGSSFSFSLYGGAQSAIGIRVFALSGEN